MVIRVALSAVALWFAALPANAWDYSSDKDQMTGKERRFAMARSKDSLALKFPYAGNNYGGLIVRHAGRTEVMFTIDKGQLMCHSSDCDFAIKFGEKPPMQFSGSRPADNSSNVIFLTNPGRFVAEARKAKTILVQVNIFQNGAPVLQFDNPAPLEWPSK